MDEEEEKRKKELEQKNQSQIGVISKFFQKKPGERSEHYSEQVKYALIEAQVVEEPKDEE